MKDLTLVLCGFLMMAGVTAGGAAWACNPFSNPFSPYAVDDCTAALWHFDEADGNDVIDASSHHNDAIAFGTSVVQGRFGLARHFIDPRAIGMPPDYAVRPITASLELTGSFSVEAWFKVDDFSQSMPLQSNDDVIVSCLDYVGGTTQDVGGYQLIVERVDMSDTGWACRFEVRPTEPPVQHERVTAKRRFSVADNGTWHHAAGVYEKSTTGPGGILKIFVDGIFQDSSIYSREVAYTLVDSIYIGTNRHLWDERRMFGGSIDEVRISNVARAFAPDTLRFHANSATQGTLCVHPDSGVHIQYDVSSGSYRQMISSAPFTGDFDVVVDMNAACTPGTGYHTKIWIGDTTGYGFRFGVNTIHCGSTPSHDVEKYWNHYDFYGNGGADDEHFTTGQLGQYVPLRVVRAGGVFRFIYNGETDAAYSDTASISEVFLGFEDSYATSLTSRNVSDAYFRVVSATGYSFFNYSAPLCPGVCSCPHQGDIAKRPSGDGVLDVFDVIELISIAFSGEPDPQDATCPITRADVDNNGITDVFDVIYLIATAFSGGVEPVSPCSM